MDFDRDSMLHAAILPRPRIAMEAVYVIEVNPRASMTVPFVSKACMANIPAARLGLGSIQYQDAPTGGCTQ